MRRRDFVGGMAGLTLAPPTRAWAQQSKIPVIGFLGSATPVEWKTRLDAFRAGLAETGFIEGQTVLIEYRWAEGRNDRLKALAGELVDRGVDAIAVLGNTQSTLAAKAATSTIPIIVRLATDPVGAGIVASLGRPGGNITGITTLGAELAAKHLELLRELLPNSRSVALLVNPTNPVIAQNQVRDMPKVAADLGIDLAIIKASTDAEITAAFADAAAKKAAGVIVSADTFFNSRNEKLAELAIKHAMAGISAYREFPLAGGLMSYGGSIKEASREAGVYAGRILKGEKPAELPVVQASKVELLVNLKTAATLGIKIPPSILLRADEAIE